MSRVRISTTVDGSVLDQLRRLVGTSDSEMLDQALRVLLDQLETEREREILVEHPYEDDPDLAWVGDFSGPPLPYDGEIPAEVLALAKARRQR